MVFWTLGIVVAVILVTLIAVTLEELFLFVARSALLSWSVATFLALTAGAVFVASQIIRTTNEVKTAFFAPIEGAQGLYQPTIPIRCYDPSAEQPPIRVVSRFQTATLDICSGALYPDGYRDISAKMLACIDGGRFGGASSFEDQRKVVIKCHPRRRNFDALSSYLFNYYGVYSSKDIEELVNEIIVSPFLIGIPRNQPGSQEIILIVEERLRWIYLAFLIMTLFSSSLYIAFRIKR